MSESRSSCLAIGTQEPLSKQNEIFVSKDFCLSKVEPFLEDPCLLLDEPEASSFKNFAFSAFTGKGFLFLLGRGTWRPWLFLNWGLRMSSSRLLMSRMGSFIILFKFRIGSCKKETPFQRLVRRCLSVEVSSVPEFFGSNPVGGPSESSEGRAEAVAGLSFAEAVVAYETPWIDINMDIQSVFCLNIHGWVYPCLRFSLKWLLKCFWCGCDCRFSNLSYQSVQIRDKTHNRKTGQFSARSTCYRPRFAEATSSRGWPRAASGRSNWGWCFSLESRGSPC